MYLHMNTETNESFSSHCTSLILLRLQTDTLFDGGLDF